MNTHRIYGGLALLANRRRVALLAGLIGVLTSIGSRVPAADVIFVSNPANLTIDKFAMDGSSLGTIDVSSFGSYGLAVNSAGILYASNLFGQIVRFDAAGNALDPNPASPFVGGLSSPYFLAIGASDRIYASNYGGNSVAIFDTAGTNVGTITSNVSQPYGIAFDGSGNLYVANFGSNRVTTYDPSGNYRTGFDIVLANGKNPIGLAVGQDGRVYVANYYGSEVAMYDWDSVNSVWVKQGDITAGLSTPKTLTTDAAGNLYAANQAGNSLTKYTPAGAWQNGFAPAGLTGPFGVAIGVPEPSTYVMGGLAGFAMWLVVRRSRGGLHGGLAEAR